MTGQIKEDKVGCDEIDYPPRRRNPLRLVPTINEFYLLGSDFLNSISILPHPRGWRTSNHKSYPRTGNRQWEELEKAKTNGIGLCELCEVTSRVWNECVFNFHNSIWVWLLPFFYLTEITTVIVFCTNMTNCAASYFPFHCDGLLMGWTNVHVLWNT